jgi:hypothetical protein
MAAESDKTGGPLATADCKGEAPEFPSRTGLKDWMESDPLPAEESAGPKCVSRESPRPHDPWASTPGLPSATANTSPTGATLLPESEILALRSRWNAIQAEFVDEPRRSVEQADKLVADTVQKLAEGFSNERGSLEKQWDNADNVSTEDLRIALQRYRAFFSRLLNAA